MEIKPGYTTLQRFRIVIPQFPTALRSQCLGLRGHKGARTFLAARNHSCLHLIPATEGKVAQPQISPRGKHSTSYI